MSTPPIQPFRPHIDIREIERLHAKLRDVRVPTQDVVPDSGNDYGIPTSWPAKLHDYWLNKYSWSAAEGRINQFDHFTTEIEGIKLHFVHQKSRNEDAIPILLIHGWPGSFYEFIEVIKSLTEGRKGLSFHCVVPSLPGFCWSSAPPRKGWTVKDTVRVFDALMQRLGYEQYCMQAGGWGAMVARELGARYASSCKVMHLNWYPGALPEGVEMTEREAKCVARPELEDKSCWSVGWMLEDNPVGLMFFVGEKYQEASNPRIHDSAHWMDHVLTTVSLYFHTRCIASSALMYYENPRHDQFSSYCVQQANTIKCPFGYTIMGYDTAPNSKRAVEQTGNLVWYKERDDAGHFACLEAPQALIEDILDVVAKHWN